MYSIPPKLEKGFLDTLDLEDFTNNTYYQVYSLSKVYHQDCIKDLDALINMFGEPSESFIGKNEVMFNSWLFEDLDRAWNKFLGNENNKDPDLFFVLTYSTRGISFSYSCSNETDLFESKEIGRIGIHFSEFVTNLFLEPIK